MKPLSSIAEAVQASSTMAIDALFKQMKADGIDVIGFGAGEPDFDTPDDIKAAGIAAIENNQTRYTPAAGTVELRQAVCDRMKADCGLEYKPSQVIATSGAKHAVYIALRALVNPGDEVILPAPFWVSYYELIKMVGGTPVVITATEEEHFKLTPEKLSAAVTPRTKALILNNPSNPTGMMYNREELQAIADVCVKNEIYVVDDEIYYGLVYDGAKFVSLPSLGPEIKDLCILINGVSKSYAMTGWRIGYACANDYIVARMNSIPGVSCIKPEGAFYVMMNLEQILGRTLYGVQIETSDDFAGLFLKKGLVAVVPGTGFGAPNFVRWSYATSMDNIKEGLNRLEKFLAE